MNKRNRRFYRVFLGSGHKYSEECRSNGFIGVDFGLKNNLNKNLSAAKNWRDFNKKMIPEYLKIHPQKSKISAGLACGATWTVSKGIKKGDIVLSPQKDGLYRAGEVISDYYFEKDGVLPHRRKVNWLPKPIERRYMSQKLNNSANSISTTCDLSKYSSELEQLILGQAKTNNRY